MNSTLRFVVCLYSAHGSWFRRTAVELFSDGQRGDRRRPALHGAAVCHAGRKTSPTCYEVGRLQRPHGLGGGGGRTIDLLSRRKRYLTPTRATSLSHVTAQLLYSYYDRPHNLLTQGRIYGVTRVTIQPPPLTRQPITCYYYACDLSYFDVVLCPSTSQILAHKRSNFILQ